MFNPATPLDWLDYTLEKLDLVLIMSVNPGFGGQSFIPGALEKLAAGAPAHRCERAGRAPGSRRRREGREYRRDRAAGADTFVAGSAIFGAPDYAQVIGQMRSNIAAALAPRSLEA